MKKSINHLLIIIFNIIPIFGVAFFNWQPFEAFWFFWVETLIIAFFNCIRIVFSQSQLPGEVDTKKPMVYNTGKGIKYLIIRFGVFIFYSIFIVVFIGFIANNNSDKSMVLGTLLFQNKLFNLGLLISFVSQCFHLIIDFFKSGAYYTASPDNFGAIFDGRQIVIHVAIVVGALGSMFITQNTSYGHLGGVFIISLLCIGKCFYDIIGENSTNKIL
ncbi:MAG: DUF6498-containing protein [Ferruginibacter sp.]